MTAPRPVRFSLLAGVALGLCVYLAYRPHHLLRLWGERLQHWEQLPARADAVFILLGEVLPRTAYAAALMREGRAPIVAMARPESSAVVRLGLAPPEDVIACGILSTLGIADSCVVVLPGPVASTLDEAEAAAAWAGGRGLRRLIFVTSSYHSARSRWILGRVLESRGIVVHVAAAPVPEVDYQPWWQNEDGLVRVFNETVKTLFYRIRYRRLPC
ncbi:YdcF family protein [Candidatus Fermentibacteria bacterium]|nr:YdcF family protein [Candidatus Fermentibacteria bacterium]